MIGELSASFRLSRLALPMLVAMVTAIFPAPAAALDPGSPLARYTRQVWSTENGLPQNSVHAMLQTSDGFLWIATEGGLARFDGYQFRIFDRTTEPHLPGNDVRCLFEDRAHALWIGTASGLTRLSKDGVMRTFTVADGLPSDAIRSVIQTDDGMLWVWTEEGLAAAGDALKFRAFTRSDGMLSEVITGVTAAGSGGVWVGTREGLNHIAGRHVERGPAETVGVPIDAIARIRGPGDSGALLVATPTRVVRIADGAVATMAARKALPAGSVLSLLSTPGGVWVIGRNSASLVQPGGTQTFATGLALPGTQIETAFQDRRGAVWIGTNGGLARWVNGKMETITLSDDATSAVLSLFEDREGDLWVGRETGGAVLLRDRSFDIIGRSQGLLKDAVTSVVQGTDSVLWVGTNGGGVTEIDKSGRATRSFRASNGLASDTVLALGAGNDADLWVGTPDGLSLLHQGRWSTYTSANGLPDDLIRSLLVSRDGAVWVGTRHGLSRMKDGRFTAWTTADRLGSDLIGAMLEDGAGDLWIGTLGGLSLQHRGSIRNFTVADGLPSNTITAMEETGGGALWVGTNGHGLARWDGRRFFSFAQSHAIPREIFAILQDGAGSLWLSSDHGIDRIALADLDDLRAGKVSDVATTHYGTADGLPSLEGAGAGHPSGWRMLDGRLCFATRRGLVIIDPVRLPMGQQALPVVLEEVTIDDRSVSPRELASIAPGSAHFSFTFAGISIAAPQRVQYRYKLEGFDRDWVEAGSRRTAFYTNLPHGLYRFRVQARSGAEPWDAAEASVPLQLEAHFYQRNSFRLLLLVLFVAALIGLYRLRVGTLRSRFDAVAAERSRMAREIHDTLAQGFVAISVRLELMAQLLRMGRAEDLAAHVDETRGLVRTSLAEARRSIWDMRAQQTTEARTLPARLASVVQQAASTSTAALELETTGTYHPLGQTIEDELFRIAQEAVANAIRHGKPTNVRLRLAYTVEHVSLAIADDGCGFDPAHALAGPQGHFGLTGIKERAHQIDATVMLESMPGKGTTVRIDLPLRNDRRPARKKS